MWRFTEKKQTRHKDAMFALTNYSAKSPSQRRLFRIEYYTNLYREKYNMVQRGLSNKKNCVYLQGTALRFYADRKLFLNCLITKHVSHKSFKLHHISFSLYCYFNQVQFSQVLLAKGFLVSVKKHSIMLSLT